jgi:hypothetical protein
LTKSEPRVIWPNLSNPVIIRRDLTIMVSAKGSNKKEPVLIENIKLEILVNNTLYVARENVGGVFVGHILSRNMGLTAKVQQNLALRQDHVFQQFRSINDLRRAYSRINPKYHLLSHYEAKHVSGSNFDLENMSWVLSNMCSEDGVGFIWHPAQLDLNLVVSNSSVSSREISPKILKRSREYLQGIHRLRGVGRMMEHRAVVLEVYLAQLHEKCISIRSYVMELLNSNELFGHSRTNSLVRKAVENVDRYSNEVHQISIRPFKRSLSYVVLDLQEASHLMSSAADQLNASMMTSAGDALRRVYRSMILLQQHWVLEEILLIVAWYQNQKQVISSQRIEFIHKRLVGVYDVLTRADVFTGQRLDEGFRHQILESVVGRLVLVKSEFCKSSLNLKEVYKQLKYACSIF